jgi:hypothetical protein
MADAEKEFGISTSQMFAIEFQEGSMSRPSKRVLAFIRSSTRSWQRDKAGAAALTDIELKQAEGLELMGRRRNNKLMVIKAERQRRAGRPEKMLSLKVESKL